MCLWVWCDFTKIHLIFCMIVRQHLAPKQKELLDHKVRLCLIFCYLQWTLLLKTTTFFGIRHQSLFALMNLNMWDYIWYDIKILPWMKESLCIVVKVANGKSIFHVFISRELRYISTGDLPWITIKSSPSEGWPSPCLCVRQKVISSPPCLPSLPPTKRSLSNFVFASSATLSLAYIVIFAWFETKGTFLGYKGWITQAWIQCLIIIFFESDRKILIFISKYKKIEKNGLRLEA